MESIRTKKEQQIEWRRNKVQELSVKGFSQADISRMLNIPKVTISRDVSYLKEEAKETIRNHIQDRLPYEYNKCLKGLEEIIKESWIISAKAEKIGDNREKLSSLALIKDSYSTKMDLLTNASLLQDSIKFVEQTKEKILSTNNNGNKNEKEEQENEEVNKQQDDIQGFSQDNRTSEPTDTVF